jgi:hypothetical protein
MSEHRLVELLVTTFLVGLAAWIPLTDLLSKQVQDHSDPWRPRPDEQVRRRRSAAAYKAVVLIAMAATFAPFFG